MVHLEHSMMAHLRLKLESFLKQTPGNNAEENRLTQENSGGGAAVLLHQRSHVSQHPSISCTPVIYKGNPGTRTEHYFTNPVQLVPACIDVFLRKQRRVNYQTYNM